jgi:hypothetical protein
MMNASIQFEPQDKGGGTVHAPKGASQFRPSPRKQKRGPVWPGPVRDKAAKIEREAYSFLNQ